MQVPFVALNRQYENLRSELMQEFDRIGQSGVYIMGETLERFETEMSRYCQTSYALGVANGSDALFLILKALGIGAGDEVITCPNSFIATGWVIVATGAKPVFVDVSEDYNMDASKLESVITTRTRAMMPVHLTGRAADMDAIHRVANKYSLAVIEDAAQAIGAKYKNKPVGSLGTAAGFSLHPLKNLGVYGDAGLITTNDFALYSKINRLRNHGLKNRDECEIWGYNSRLDPLQAAFALVKLKYLDSWNDRHRKIAAYYRENLKNHLWVPEDQDYEEPIYHNFVIQLEKRDELSRYLEQKGIGSRVHYPIPIHMQACAAELGYKKGDFPVTERLAKRILSLPIYPELTDAEVEYVVKSAIEFYDEK